MNFQNKVVVVTGGTRGIGLETVRAFLEYGAKVILFGSRKETVINAINELEKEGKKAAGYYSNLNDYEEVLKTIQEIVTQYGKIDILINNAGISANKKIEETTSEEFTSIMNLNVDGVFNV